MKNNWMQQIQSMIGQKTGSIGGSEGIGKLLAPTALGGLWVSYWRISLHANWWGNSARTR
jgi:hypothetical protein